MVSASPANLCIDNRPTFNRLYHSCLLDTDITTRFMLRYETRDTVAVLAHGSKGLQEMRDTAMTYYSSESDIKPLFGFTQFRRRKVLIRLVPDDVSRLFKGRRPLVPSTHVKILTVSGQLAFKFTFLPSTRAFLPMTLPTRLPNAKS